jgi:acyl-CoA thioester hydrolase
MPKVEHIMPLTHLRTFRVRHYECDAYGHVNHTNYLRYAQETAFDASAAAGYDMARYDAMGRSWLIRENEIEYLHPLRYGDSLQVKTWVVDFRRVRSRRAYEFRHGSSGELVARACTDWAFLDTTTNRPADIPLELKLAFIPEGATDRAPPRERFPAAPSPPPGAFHRQRRAEWRDLDPAGHVNNAVYLAYVEDIGVQLTAAHHWPMARLEAEGLGIVARHHRIEYKQPAVLDDELELSTWISDVSSSTAMRHTTITRLGDGALLARARTVHVWIDTATGQPTPIPGTLLADFAPCIAEHQDAQGAKRIQ